MNIDKGSRTARQRVAIKGVNAHGQEVHFESIHSVDKAGFDKGTVAACLRGKYKTHAGYTWSVTSRGEPRAKGPCRVQQVVYLRNVKMLTNLEMAEEMGLGIGRVHALVKQANKAGLMKFSGYDIYRLRREAKRNEKTS